MRIPHLLLPSLLISLCVATAAAQSSPSRNSNSQPAPLQIAQANPDLFQFQFTADVEEPNSSPVSRPVESSADSLAVPALGPHMPHIVTLEQDQATCYTIRAYRVARENPDSDVVRPAGYSTCQRASRFQFKTAVDSREIVPR
jgi:hypothetical protein